MLKYAIITNETTKSVSVGLGDDVEFYKSIGMSQMEVEQAYDGNWYLQGFAPTAPEKSYIEKRLAEYPSIGDQLDMIYWDKINGTTYWQDCIRAIKTKYPKE